MQPFWLYSLVTLLPNIPKPFHMYTELEVNNKWEDFHGMPTAYKISTKKNFVTALETYPFNHVEIMNRNL